MNDYRYPGCSPGYSVIFGVLNALVLVGPPLDRLASLDLPLRRRRPGGRHAQISPSSHELATRCLFVQVGVGRRTPACVFLRPTARRLCPEQIHRFGRTGLTGEASTLVTARSSRPEVAVLVLGSAPAPEIVPRNCRALVVESGWLLITMEGSDRAEAHRTRAWV